MTPDGVVERLVILLGVDVQKKEFKDGIDAASNLAAAVLGAAGAIAALVASTAAAGDEVLSTARKVQVSTEALTEFYHVADDLGSSNDAVVSGFRFLSRSIGEAVEKSGEARDAFHKVGLSVRDLKRLPLDQVLSAAADGFGRLRTDAERTRLAMQLFGRGGVELLPVLMAGSDEIEALRKQARELGIVWRQEDAEAADQLNDSIGRLTGVGAGLARRFAIDLIPTFQTLADSAEAWWKANRDVILQRLDRTAADVARAFAALNTPLGMTVALLTTLAGAKVAANLASTVPVVGQLMGALAPIAGYAVAAVALYVAFDSFRTAAEGGDSAVGRLAEKMGVGGEFDAAVRNTKGLLEEANLNAVADGARAVGGAFSYVATSVNETVKALGDLFDLIMPDWLKNLLGSDPFGGSPTRWLLGSIGEQTGRAAEGFAAYNAARTATAGNAEGTSAVNALFLKSLRDTLIGPAFGEGRDTSGPMPFLRLTGSEASRSALQNIVVSQARGDRGIYPREGYGMSVPPVTVNVNLQGDRLAPGDAEQIRRAVTGAVSDAAAEFP